MAFSKCPHCKGGFFELKEVSPQGSNFKQNFVQCAGCGAPVGVVDYSNTAMLLGKQEKRIAALQQEVGALSHDIRQILRVLQRS
jgi:hypothetical protein